MIQKVTRIETDQVIDLIHFYINIFAYNYNFIKFKKKDK